MSAWAELSKVTDYSLGDTPDTPTEVLLRTTLAMKLKDYATATKILNTVMPQAPQLSQGYMLYDLRAACALHLQQAEQALDDAMLCTKLCPQWPRGWARLGAAQLCLGHYRASVSAYKKAIELESGAGSREMQLGLQLAGKALAGQGDRRAAVHEEC